jgi:adenine-specific DNA-methyltransferase
LEGFKIASLIDDDNVVTFRTLSIDPEVSLDRRMRDSYDPGADIVIQVGDALDFLESVPDGDVDLVVTSPPYNIGKEYEGGSSVQEYLKSMAEVIHELFRVVSGTGSVCWETGNYVENGEIIPLDILFYPIFTTLGFHLRNRIVWHFDHGLHCTKRYSGRYETILWFTKTNEYTFNLDDVRVPSKYPGKKAFRGPKKGKLSGNPLGKNPSDVWSFLGEEWESAFWDIPNVKNNHPEKTDHPCQFPIELCERCVLSLTNPGDRVIDPFAGAGSTLIAALMHGRRAAGVDKEQSYIDISKKRVDALFDGRLRYRPMGTPIYVPSAREKTAKGGE